MKNISSFQITWETILKFPIPQQLLKGRQCTCDFVTAQVFQVSMGDCDCFPSVDRYVCSFVS